MLSVGLLIYPGATLRNGIHERPAVVRPFQSGRRLYNARVLSVDQTVLRSRDTNIDLSRARSTDAIVSRIATRTTSSTSTLQHSHTIAVRRCAAVVRETPSPPPMAIYAAMHMGHFGTSASAMVGSANAVALRVRDLDLFSVLGRPGAGAEQKPRYAGKGKRDAPLCSAEASRTRFIVAAR